MQPPPHDSEFHFVDPRTTPFAPLRSRGELPHLYKSGGTYFVTFRLIDAVVAHKGRAVTVPTSVRRGQQPPAIATAGETDLGPDGRAELSPEQIAESAEPPLTLGSCFLRRAGLAHLVVASLRRFDGERYYLSAWCVMPNHVHVVFSPLCKWDANRDPAIVERLHRPRGKQDSRAEGCLLGAGVLRSLDSTRGGLGAIHGLHGA